jgi:acyl-CoA-binding protein
MEIVSEFECILNNLKKNEIINTIKISDAIKLDLYKFYKQATEGDCNIPKPYVIYIEASAKWVAWDSIRGMSKEDAMKEYIDIYNKYISKYVDLYNT